MSSKIEHTSNSFAAPDYHPRLSDYLRQILNLILAPLMWILSTLSFFDPNARSPQGLSEINESLLVPTGFAFSIWFPIFVGCITYGVVQSLGTNRTRAVYRAIGWWTAAGFGLVCIWALISAYAPDSSAQWGTAIVFIPAMLCLVKAMLAITRNRSALCRYENLLVFVPLSLIAGWTSIAVFLNWTPIIAGLTSAFLTGLMANVLMLVLALIWAAFVIRKSGGNRAYAFPIIWGLSFLTLKQLVTEPTSPIIGMLAVIGALILIGVTAFKPRAERVGQYERSNYI
jgi:hypothetical protein